MLKMIDSDYKQSITLDYFVTNISLLPFPTEISEIYVGSANFLDFFNNILKNVFNSNLKLYSKFIKPWISKFISGYIFESEISFGRPDTMYYIKNKNLKYLGKISWEQVSGFAGGSYNKRTKKELIYSFYNTRPKYDISIMEDMM